MNALIIEDEYPAAERLEKLIRKADPDLDVMAVLEGFGLREGANSEPREFVVEKAFVGEGV